MLAPLLLLALPLTARANAVVTLSLSKGDNGWSNWNTSRVVVSHGYPVFEVDGRPFFVYGAAFFYERIPREEWASSLAAYKRLGINTIDLYAIWNWHAPSPDVLDFTGATDPQRDLLGLLNLTHNFGFKVILRPGPVIRNEWRNGGYPAWLLERPEYKMPLHDVLEGRYPATATFQNAHADAAAAEWLANPSHMSDAPSWLRNVLTAVAPYSHDVIAIALDDDQGAYLDNDTWPAPHWHSYIGWLRQTVTAVAGTRVPLFINTYEMKVPSASPAWAWGNWYQSNSYRLTQHDLADLDFATGLLQTQRALPVMQSEFQAGWLQSADEAAPRPSDPSSTALALAELLRDGAHGIVNFPVQDTIYPHGWEAPWANWSYAWDAALTSDLHASQRYAPTAAFGEIVRRYGARLATTHVAANAAIIWPPSLFVPGSLSNDDFAAYADATTRMQRACNARGIGCTLVDLVTSDDGALRRYPAILLPLLPTTIQAGRMEPWAETRLAELRRSGRLVADPSAVPLRGRAHLAPYTTLLLGDDGTYGFIAAVNPSDSHQTFGPFHVALPHRVVTVAAFSVPARGTKLIPVGLSGVILSGGEGPPATPGTPPSFSDPSGTVLANAHLRVVFAPFAGARIAELGDAKNNAATSIGLLRDATDPQPPISSRDYIGAYTHPMPAGTFNRRYECTRADAINTQRIICLYDSPDLPSGGALFKRTLTLTGAGNELRIGEEFTPHDSRSTARLTSISGFAFVSGDRLLRSTAGDAVGILHGARFAVLRWRREEVARLDLRPTRGAELVTLIF
ncbi:MAG TPA: beta-galactosidase, partial [Candidatus Nitrosotalea sp.]|nr:beta-galactosidase [Candidatus Nitrosotalea sp.]